VSGSRGTDKELYIAIRAGDIEYLEGLCLTDETFYANRYQRFFDLTQDMKQMFFVEEDHFLDTPLVIAIIEDSKESAEWLLENGADPNQSYMGASYLVCPLLVAILRQKIDIIQLLLKNGAELNSDSYRIGSKDTMAHIALKDKNSLLVIDLLSSLGVKIDMKNSGGDTPLLWLVKRRKSTLFPVKRQEEEIALVAKLIELGASITSVDMHGHDVLFYARKQKPYLLPVLLV